LREPGIRQGIIWSENDMPMPVPDELKQALPIDSPGLDDGVSL